MRFAEAARCSVAIAFTSFESLRRLESLYADTTYTSTTLDKPGLKSLETQKKLLQCNPRIKKAKKVGKSKFI